MFLRENLLNGFVIKINWITIFLLKLAWKYNLNFFTTIGLKFIFHWIAQHLILFRSLFNLIVDMHSYYELQIKMKCHQQKA